MLTHFVTEYCEHVAVLLHFGHDLQKGGRLRKSFEMLKKKVILWKPITIGLELGLTLIVRSILARWTGTLPLWLDVVVFLSIWMTLDSLKYRIRGLLFRRPKVPAPEPLPGFTQEILFARRNFYAISSKPLALWESPTFIYYLVLNGIKTLSSYCQEQEGAIFKLSQDEADKRRFYDEGFEVIKAIADGRPPPFFHGIRFLIYPNSVLEERRHFIETLLDVHFANRIFCLPLVKEKLIKALTCEEKKKCEELSLRLSRTRSAVFRKIVLRLTGNWILICL